MAHSNIWYFLTLDIGQTLCDLIEKMTGIEPEMDSTLDEVGLASVGIPVIVGMLNSAFSTKNNPISVTAADLVEAKTIEDIGRPLIPQFLLNRKSSWFLTIYINIAECVPIVVGVVEVSRARMEQDGV